MRIPEPIETVGHFWLPEQPDQQISGTLRVSRHGRVEVDFIGLPVKSDSTSEINRILNSRQADIDRICGVVKDYGHVTLEKCVPQSLQLGSIATSSFVAHFAIIGVAIEQDELLFDEFDFEVEGLEQWLCVSGIKVEFDRDNKSGEIYFRHLPPICHNLSENITLNFDFRSSFPSGFSPTPIADVRLTHLPLISITVDEPKDVSYFISQADKISRFFSLAVDHELMIQSMAFPKAQNTGESALFRIESPKLYCETRPPSKEQVNIRPHNILFVYPGIENRFAEIMSNWLRNYEMDAFGVALNLYFTAAFSAVPYLDSRFIYLAQGVEVLHRKMFSESRNMNKEDFNELRDRALSALPENCPDFLKNRIYSANYKSLRDQIKELVDPFIEWFRDQERSEEFAKQISDMRNSFTHPSGSRLEVEAEELQKIYTKLETLILLYLLQITGFNKQEIAYIASHSHRFRSVLEDRICVND